MRFVIAFGMTVGLAIAACSSSDETFGTGAGCAATTEPERNDFKFGRIDAVQGCADIVAMQDTLFQP